MSVLFQDREQAGQELAKELEETLIKNQKINLSNASDEIIVLAIPRGGIILGDIIAKHFQCGLDVVISRKIRAEFNEEFAIGAMMPDGSYFLNEEGAVQQDPVAEAAHITEIVVSANGPYIIKSECLIKHSDGREEIKQGTTTLCRCGNSKNKPYCDGSHTGAGFVG